MRNFFLSGRLFQGVFIAVFLAFAACSSQKENSAKVPQGVPAWDYKSVRDSREAESAQTPAGPSADDANCIIMTRDEMIRGKASGCKPLDARLGYGQNAFCCPK